MDARCGQPRSNDLVSPSYVGAPRCPIPATGPGADTMQTKTKYVIEGVHLDHGLSANNGSLYHLELTTPPSEALSAERPLPPAVQLLVF